MTKDQEKQDRETLEEVRKTAPRIEAATGIKVIIGHGHEAPPSAGPAGWAPDPNTAKVQAEQDYHQELVAEELRALQERKRLIGLREAEARAKAAKESKP